MSKSIRVVVAIIPLLIATAAIATPFEGTVDPGESTITMELCMTIPAGQKCDSGSSSVEGWAIVSLDCLTDPSQIVLHDFHFWLQDDIDLHLDWALGDFYCTAHDLEVFYEGEPLPPAELGPSGDFTYIDVPVAADGEFIYEATGTVCAYMRLLGLDCADTWGIALFEINPMTANGNVQVDGRNVTITLDVDLYAPILPNLPSLGGMSVSGTLVGHAVVPVPDIPTFTGILLGDLADLDLVCESDINQDGLVNGLDIQPYIEFLLNR